MIYEVGYFGDGASPLEDDAIDYMFVDLPFLDENGEEICLYARLKNDTWVGDCDDYDDNATYEALKDEIIRQAKEKGIDPGRLCFLYDTPCVNGFTKVKSNNFELTFFERDEEYIRFTLFERDEEYIRFTLRHNPININVLVSRWEGDYLDVENLPLESHFWNDIAGFDCDRKHSDPYSYKINDFEVLVEEFLNEYQQENYPTINKSRCDR